MKQTKVLCDICGREKATTIWFTIDRQMDAAGSMDDVCESLDLCGEHMFECYSILLLREEDPAKRRGAARHVYMTLRARTKNSPLRLEDLS